MGVSELLRDRKFNIFFSFILGIGIVCIFKPICSGSECNIDKAPSDKDFDKYVYKMNGNNCFEFKSEIVTCPSSGALEAFRECPLSKSDNNTESFHDIFSRRTSPIKRCE